jgi:uncharacterized protein with PhoU and TrkA domain
VVSLLSRFLPNSKKNQISEDYNLDEFITKVIITKSSDVIGKSIGETFLHNNEDLEVLKLKRDGIINDHPGQFTSLKENDQLLLRCNMENLIKLRDTSGFTVIKGEDTKN